MKPLKLELQAFGPFVERQEVDFEKLSENGIFLIKGNTGSGKTTIFDAMTFALYGGGSGEDSKSKTGRNDIAEWRCMQADGSLDTYVALTFSVHDRKYYFKRSLELKRKNYSAHYEAGEIDDDGNIIPFFNNPKKDDLTNKAEELVGLTKEQFRQVVLLPQGQFERFLTASSDEKEVILQKIFGTEQWERYAKWFFTIANDAKAKLDDEKTEVLNDLAEEGVATVEELAAKIESTKTEKAELEREHIAFDGKKKQDALNADRVLLVDFKNLHSIEDRLAELEAESDAIDALRKAHTKAEKAESMREAIRAFEEAQKAFDARKKELNDRQSELPAAEQAEAKAKAAKEEHEKDSPVEELTKTIIEYANKTEAYQKYEKLKKELAAANKSFKAAKAEAEKAEAAHNAAVKAAADSKKDFDAADETARDYRNRYFNGIYGEIAASLEDGKECPVCGSKAHPHPAERTEDSVSKEEMQEAQDSADEKKKLWTSRDNARIEAEKTYREADDYLDKKLREKDIAEAALQAAESNLIEGIANEKALQDRINELKQEIEDYNAEAKALQEALDGASNALVKLREAINHADDEKKKAEAAVKDAEAALKKALTENGYSDISEPKADMKTSEERQQMNKRVVEYDKECKDNRKLLSEKSLALDGKTEPDESGFEEREQAIKAEADEYSRRDEALRGTIDRLSEKLVMLEEKWKHYKENIRQAESDLAFARKLRGDTGIGIQRYVLAIMFNQVIGEANRMLENVHGGRYRLFRTDDNSTGRKRGLELKVHDSRAPEKDGRSVSMLSGGEKFLVSLALSIGMSTVAQKTGVQIEALFIDEGFGTLDNSSINDAMNVLDSVRRTSGTIGIISHVQLLEANIPTHLEVIKKDSGSRIAMC